MEKDKGKARERWEECIKDLHGNMEKTEHYRIRNSTDGPKILESEVKYAMEKPKRESSRA